MNPNNPSRDEIEARITALLLGELPEDEAHLLRWTISQDAGLKKLHDELASIIVLVREVQKTPAETSAENTPAIKLSAERRAKLLAHFQTPQPPTNNPLFWLKPITVLKAPRLIEVLAVVAIVALLAAMLLPALSKAKSRAMRVSVLSGERLKKTEAQAAPSGLEHRTWGADNSYPEQVAAPATPVSAPVAVTVAAAPVLAPPPAPIYLPTTPETAGHELAAGDKRQNFGAFQVGVAGDGSVTRGTYEAAALDSTVPETPASQQPQSGSFAFGINTPADSGAALSDKPTDDEGKKQNQFYRNRITGGSAGGGGGAGDTFELANGPANLGEESRRQMTLAGAVANHGVILPGAAAGVPQEKLPEIALNKTGGEISRLDEFEGMIKSGSSALASGGAVSYTLTNSIVSSDQFYSSPAKDDIGRLRNAVVDPATGLPAAPKQQDKDSVVVNEKVLRQAKVVELDKPVPHALLPAPIPQPEILTRDNNFSTFSLNVSDVSFKLAAASLERGLMPDAASIRSEEFINAFDYRDPEAAAGQPLAFTAERARYPFAHNRDLLRFSVKTAAAGRQAGRALNLVLLLDNSGSMERADRVAIIREALRVLATQLQPQDTVSVVTFARTARLWADGVHGDQAGETLNRVGGITPEGGTNLEEAMKLAYETAHRHYLANGMNRVVLLTDGAANLGDVNPADLKQKVEAQRKQGIALDCFGIGSQDFNDDLLEQLSRNGDGRYAFLNSTDDAAKEFAAKLAGALQVAAQDVKVQVEFNPQRVISWRQIGYAKHQFTKEQFRDNTVDAAEIAAQEAGNALYTVETKADGVGPIATVRVRYKVPGTTDYRERSWDVPYGGSAAALAQSSPAMRLAATAGAFSEWLAASPFAQEVTPDELLKTLSGVPQIYGADQRPQKLEWMIRQAKSVAGK